MSSSKCFFLTCIQISQEAGQVVLYSHLFQNFPQFFVIHTVKGFGIVNKAEIDVFLELSCFFHDPADVGNLISGSSAFLKSSLNIWKFSVHVLLKTGLENFEHYFASVWNECNCVVVWIAKECSNYRTIALLSCTSKVMLKILQARIQQYMNHELPDVQAEFRKGRRTRDQIANICWITEKAREFQKNIYLCFVDYAKAFDCVDHNKLWKILRDGNIRPPFLPWEIYM